MLPGPQRRGPGRARHPGAGDAETSAVMVSRVGTSFGALIASTRRAVRRDTTTPLRLVPPVDDDVADVVIGHPGTVEHRPAETSARLALVYSADGT